MARTQALYGESPAMVARRTGTTVAALIAANPHKPTTIIAGKRTFRELRNGETLNGLLGDGALGDPYNPYPVPTSTNVTPIHVQAQQAPQPLVVQPPQVYTCLPEMAKLDPRQQQQILDYVAKAKTGALGFLGASADQIAAATVMAAALAAHGYKQADQGIYMAFQRAMGGTADGFPGTGTMGKLQSVLSSAGIPMPNVTIYPWHATCASGSGDACYDGTNAPTLAEWQGAGGGGGVPAPSLPPSILPPTSSVTVTAMAAAAALALNANYCTAVGQVGSTVNTAVHNFKAAWNAANPGNPVPIGTGKYEPVVASALSSALGGQNVPPGCGASPVQPPPPPNKVPPPPPNNGPSGPQGPSGPPGGGGGGGGGTIAPTTTGLSTGAMVAGAVGIVALVGLVALGVSGKGGRGARGSRGARGRKPAHRKPKHHKKKHH